MTSLPSYISILQWAFGVTCWEVFSLGKTPYPSIDNADIVDYIERGIRLKKPSLCPKEMYVVFVCSAFRIREGLCNKNCAGQVCMYLTGKEKIPHFATPLWSSFSSCLCGVVTAATLGSGQEWDWASVFLSVWLVDVVGLIRLLMCLAILCVMHMH